MDEYALKQSLTAIHDALDDLYHLAEVAGATSKYTPAEAHPLARLREHAGITEARRWRRTPNDRAQ